MELETSRLNLQSRAKLNNGVEMPVLVLGVYQSPPGRATKENSLAFDFRLSDEDMHVLNSLNENLRTNWDPMTVP